MAVRTIPNAVSRQFVTVNGRKDLMRDYLGIYAGTNSDGETVQLSICPQLMELTTFQNNGWVRINWYDTDGQPTGEAFDGKWK